MFEIVILAFTIIVITAIAAPYFINARHNGLRPCVINLRQIEEAKQQWALELNVTNLATVPKVSDIQPYLGPSVNGTLPYCPVDKKKTFTSSYIINAITNLPQCRFTNVGPGHVLLRDW